MSKRTLHIVTGGAGFIGSNIVAALDRRDADIVVIDWLGNINKWRYLSRCRLIDLVPPSECFAALDKIGDNATSLIHMGAVSSTTEPNADLIVETNFRLSCRLWDWCARFQIPFVYASSAATYGDGANGFDDKDDPEHLARLRPLNAYAWSKHLFDRWVLDCITRGGPAPPRWAGLKFFNVFGPNEFHKEGQRSVALQIFEQIRRGKQVRLFASDNPDYPDGGQKRDFVWVDDCVDIALWFADAPRKNGIYNVGSGVARTFEELARCLYQAMDLPPDIRYVPMPDVLKGKYQYFTQANMQKLIRAGYSKPPASLEDGTRRYVQEYLIESTFPIPAPVAVGK